jgi:hypothetical protein
LCVHVNVLTLGKRSAERLVVFLIMSNQPRVPPVRRGGPRKTLSTTTMPGGDLR